MSAKIPLGIFWDIENCQIPRTKATSSVVKELRDFVAEKHPECGYAKEFSCACDVFKLGPAISESLDKNGVNVVHVNSTAKNAAEDKLQELIDMYVDKYGGTGSAVLCIISSDINLAKQIRNARRKDLDVVLIRGVHCSTDLINLVKESYIYEGIVKNADNSSKDDQQKQGVLDISNLPLNKHFEAIKSRLIQLTENCGGKPGFIQNGRTSIRFACVEDAQRCLNRINGQDVYGSKIVVTFSGENSTSNRMANRGRDRPNLAKNAEQIRNKSISRTNLAQNDPFPRDHDECKSTIKGLFTRKDENFDQVVRNLVEGWNDPQIKPHLIKDVQRSNKYGIGDGRHTLFITAVDAKACRALVDGAKKNCVKPSNLEWNHYISANSMLTNENRSVIEGLYSTRNDNVTQLVKKLVLDWNDSEIEPNFIRNVERDRRLAGKDGKVSLYVTAINPQSSKVLVMRAKKHLTAKSGIKWFQYQRKHLNDGTVGSSAQSSVPNRGNRVNRPFKRSDSSITSVIKGLQTKSDENVTQIVRKIIQDWKDTQINPNFVKLVERDRKFADKDGDVLLFVTAISAEASQALITAAAKYWQSRNDLKWSQYSRRRDADLESNVSDFDQMSSRFSSMQDLSICSSLQSLNDIPVTDDYKSVILGLETKCDQNLAKIVRKIVMNWNNKAVQANYITSVERFPGYPEADGKTPLLVTATSPQNCIALISGAEKHLVANSGIFWTHFNSGQKLVKYFPTVRPQLNQVRRQEESTQQIQSNESIIGLEPPIQPSITSNPPVPSPLPRKLKSSPKLTQSSSLDTTVDNSDSKDKSFVKQLVTGFESLFKSPKSKSKVLDQDNNIQTKFSAQSNLMMGPIVPFTHLIGDRAKTGLMMCMSGKLNKDAHSFTIDFYAKTDIAFHFDVRVRQPAVVRNSRIYGQWGSDERAIKAFPFSGGQDFDVMMKIESNQFVVSVAGNHICDFKHRMDVESVNQLSITGELTIYWMRFANN